MIVGMGENVLIFLVFNELETAFWTVIFSNDWVNESPVVFEWELDVVVDMKFEIDSMSANLFNLSFVIELRKIGMLEYSQDIDSFGGIEFEGFLDEVHAVGVNVGEVICFVGFFSGVDQVEILFVDIDFQVFDFLWCRSTRPVKNSFNLINGRRPRKHRLTSHHLPNQAPQRPNINFLRVVLTPQQKLRSPIPSGGNVVSHYDSLVILRLFKRPHQSKIAQFGIAVFIY